MLIGDPGRCIVCGEDFGLESHHLHPQALGGADLPTVMLCDKHHKMVHLAANALSKGTKGTYPKQIEVLASYIIRAKLLYQDNLSSLKDKQIKSLRIKVTPAILARLHVLKTDSGFSNLGDYVAAVIVDHVKRNT